ncbi:MAG: LysM peptidoglycan-binding domain-containing protein [Anaerolineae bacterium]|nr:LysM peptidoglycan-binding domain-containing protein [Anaerolineae bacterium]
MKRLFHFAFLHLGVKAGLASAQKDSDSRLSLCSYRTLALFCVVVGAVAVTGCSSYVVTEITLPPPTPTATAQVRLVTATLRATATVVPATPLPTATATATATAVVHVIEQGDTLLDLAVRYDVSVQALIEVNDILDPRALVVGETLIIPSDDGNVFGLQDTPTPTPMPLDIINMAFHQTPVGSLWCMGEVENERDQGLEFVQVRVSLHNAQGDPVDMASAFITTEIVPAHGTAPFAILLPNAALGRFASYQVVILSAEPLTHWGQRHRDVAVETDSWEMQDGILTVQSTIKNTGQVDAQDIQIVITCYDRDGVMVGVRRAQASPFLAAGQEESVTLSLIPLAPAARVQAVAWATNANP